VTVEAGDLLGDPVDHDENSTGIPRVGARARGDR